MVPAVAPAPKWVRRVTGLVTVAVVVVASSMTALASGAVGGSTLPPPLSDSQTLTIPVGDRRQRIFAFPGETSAYELSILPFDLDATFDVTAAAGSSIASVANLKDRFAVVVDATTQPAGATQPFRLCMRNRATGGTVEGSCEVHVLNPVVAGEAQIAETGGSVTTPHRCAQGARRWMPLVRQATDGTVLNAA